jgi:peptide/nickel transport system ATP-binding protein/oligopeptide transport system ATP-binding protein
VRGVDLDVFAGETVALVGESGAGKSTLGRLILRLIEPDEGTIEFDGDDLRAFSGRQMRRMRAHLQMVFQDPYSSFDPIMTIGESLAEPLKLHTDLNRIDRHRKVLGLLDRASLPHDYADRYPRSFSGGQLQRLAISRALTTDPALIVCDEPVAALDISIRGQILSLMVELQDERNLAYIFVTHDLSVVRHLAHRVAVMYAGEVVEFGETREIYDRPSHPYTQGLLDSIPVANPNAPRKRKSVRGELLATAALQEGCAYRTRCPAAMPRCAGESPKLVDVGAPGHRVACHLFSPDDRTLVETKTMPSLLVDDAAASRPSQG